MSPRRLNLDAHQPDDIVLTFKGTEYEMPGAIPVPSIVRMLRFQEKIEVATEGADYAAILQDVIESGDASAPGIMELIRERQADVATIPFSIQDVLAIIEFLVADLDVEEVVRNADAPPVEEEEARPLAQAS